LLAEAELEVNARELAQAMAQLAAAAALQEIAPQIAECFLQARFASNKGPLYGTYRSREITSVLLRRAHPE
jgi:hypothetical protein